MASGKRQQYRLHQMDLPEPFASGSANINAFGAPWIENTNGSVRRSSDGRIIGAFGDDVPLAAKEWIKGAADMAHALSPLTLEGTYHIRTIGHDILAFVEAVHNLMAHGAQPVLSELLEVRTPPGWWRKCQAYAVVAGTKAKYDDPAVKSLMIDEWKHRIGWTVSRSYGDLSLDLHGITRDYKMLAVGTTGRTDQGRWDGTSIIYAPNSGKILFKIRSLSDVCPQATPLFGKFMRRILNQMRTPNPLAPPELASRLADALLELRINGDQITAYINTYYKSIENDHGLRQFSERLIALQSSVELSCQGVSIGEILEMSADDRSDYYRAVRSHDARQERQARRAAPHKQFSLI